MIRFKNIGSQLITDYTLSEAQSAASTLESDVINDLIIQVGGDDSDLSKDDSLEFVHRVLQGIEPDEIEDYAIYSLLNDSSQEVFQNPKATPYNIDYSSTKHLNVRLHPVKTREKGHLTELIYYERDYETHSNIRPIIRVTYDYVHDAATAPYQAAQKTTSRTKGRQYYLSDGTLVPAEGDIIFSTKEYDTFAASRDEGTRRRTAIDTDTQEATVIILAVTQSLSEADAILLGTGLFAAINPSLSDYITTGFYVPDQINNFTDTGGQWDTLLDTVIPDDQHPAYGFLNTHAQRGAGLTIRQFLYQSYRADI